MYMNKPISLMFHEVLDNSDEKSGWHLESKGKYTITKSKFKSIINRFGDSVNYTFDDGGLSNLFAAQELKKNKIVGTFFIATNFIGKKGFLGIEDIKNISKSHKIFAHGHKHLMNNFDKLELMKDWKMSLEILKKNNFNHDTICLPGGTFSKTHFNVLNSLGVKNIYHSAPTNIFLNILYGNKMKFHSRIIVDNNFEKINKINFAGLKSVLKQIINFYR